MSYQPQVSVY